MKRTLSLLLFLSFFLCAAKAQQFIEPIEQFSIQKAGYLITADGEQIDSVRFRTMSYKKGLVKKLSVRTADGEVLKFKGEELQLFAFPPSRLGQIVSQMDAATNVNKWGNTNFDEIIQRDYVIYEQGTLPGRSGRKVMMQLINPGFDRHIKVYHDPFAGGTANVGLGGLAVVEVGSANSYYITKDGETIKAMRRKYDEQFVALFGDCPSLLEAYPDQKWNDLAEHVLYYDQQCGE